MSETILFILSLSILFPLTVAVWRWHRVKRRWLPFISLLFLGLLSETLVWLAIQLDFSWVPMNNTLILADSILIPIQFAVWGFYFPRKSLVLLLSLMVLAWIYLHIWTGSVYQFSVVFRIGYSFIIIMLTINFMNYLLLQEQQRLIKNPEFLFCIGFLIFYSYQLLYEAAYAVSGLLDDYWASLLNRIFSLINFACNIVFGIAICCIPEDPIRRWKMQ